MRVPERRHRKRHLRRASTCPFPAVIPTDYIAHLPARLAFYQRLSNITDRDHIPAVRADMQDRFGPLPPVVENLLSVTDLRCLGSSAGVESIAGAGDGIVTVVFRQPVGDARFALQNKMGPGVRVGRRDMEIRTAGDADHGMTRIARALRRVVAFRERDAGSPVRRFNSRPTCGVGPD